MEAIFKEYFWVVKVLGVALATGLGASAIITQIGTGFVLDVSSAKTDDTKEEDGESDAEEDGTIKFGRNTNPFARTREPPNMQASTKRKVGDEIKARNIFCPTCLPPEPELVTTDQPVALSPDGRPVGIQPGETRTALPLRLMATMEATDPQYSLATVYDADEGVSGLYGVGDQIRPTVVVVGVDAGILHIRNNARLEYVALGDEVRAGPRPTPAEPVPPPDAGAPTNDREIPGAEDAINCPNENTCVVDRSFVESLMSNPAMLAKQARIVPSQRDGEVQGFKFYGIRRGSLPQLLGLKNGDMLTEVNGEEIKSVDQAMSLAMKLRRASNLSVGLVRRGETLTKEIQIQ
jgi:type II secretion system protein C